MLDKNNTTNSAKAGGSALTTMTISNFTVGNNANRVLIVSVVGEEVDDVGNVTYGGVGLAEAISDTTTVGDGFEDHVSIWYGLNPAAGTADIIVSGVNDPNDPDSQNWQIGVGSFYNVLQQAPITANGTTDSDTSAASLSITGYSGGLIFEAITTNQDDTDGQALTATGRALYAFLCQLADWVCALSVIR